MLIISRDGKFANMQEAKKARQHDHDIDVGAGLLGQ